MLDIYNNIFGKRKYLDYILFNYGENLILI